MTGLEAWSLIAPIIAPHGGTGEKHFDELDEAYVTTYRALKLLDETEKKEHERN